MLYLVVIFTILIIIFAVVFKSSVKPLKDIPIPHNLGLIRPVAQPLVQRVETAFTGNDKQFLKGRVLKEHRKWQDHEFEWLFVELKRYFFLCSLFKTVPMFSSKVDELWHEMILSTQKYAHFCQQLFGQYLHHKPNIDSDQSTTNERAFFDLVYLHYFQPTENSVKIWGSFMKQPLHTQVLADFATLNEKELRMTYFRTHSEWQDIQLELIQTIKENIRSAKVYKQNNDGQELGTKSNSDLTNQSLLFIAIYFSMFNYDNYAEAVSGYLPEVLAKNGFTSSTCSGFACASNETDSHTTSNSDSGANCGGGGCSSS